MSLAGNHDTVIVYDPETQTWKEEPKRPAWTPSVPRCTCSIQSLMLQGCPAAKGKPCRSRPSDDVPF